MSTPNNPNYQAYPPQGQTAYPPQGQVAYPPQGQTTYPPHSPQEQVTSAQHPPSPVGYLPQGHPPQAQADPSQGLPPAYDYNSHRPAYMYTTIHRSSPTLYRRDCGTANSGDYHSLVTAGEGLLQDRDIRSLVLLMHAIHVRCLSHLPPSLHSCSRLLHRGPGDQWISAIAEVGLSRRKEDEDATDGLRRISLRSHYLSHHHPTLEILSFCRAEMG